MPITKIKTDPDLGKKVHEHLVSVGVEDIQLEVVKLLAPQIGLLKEG